MSIKQGISNGALDLERMSKEDEQAVFEAIRRGDEVVKNRLIASGLQFASEVALRCASSEVPYSELFSELQVTMLETIKQHDSASDETFVAYLTRRLDEQVEECYSHLTWLLPIAYHWVQLHDRYELALLDLYPKVKNPEDRNVQDEEYVADYMGVSVEELRAMKAQYAMCRVESTNKLVHVSGPINYDVGNCVPLIETIVDPRTDVVVDHRTGTTFSDELDELMGALTEQERSVVCQKEGVLSHEMQTDKRIAADLSVTEKDVEAIYQRAMSKLREVAHASKRSN